jgi:hypothetical protein
MYCAHAANPIAGVIDEWTSTFNSLITSRRTLWTSSISRKNKLLASAIQLLHAVFCYPSLSYTLTPRPDRGAFGDATNTLRTHKSWFTLWRSSEEYTLNRDGRRGRIDAHMSFSLIAFLFPEHDIYPATALDCETRVIYQVKLLGILFLDKYKVQPDKRQVQATLRNDWALGIETVINLLNGSVDLAMGKPGG